MKSLLIGINAKYIHPAIALYQLKKNTTYDTLIKEYTIKQDSDEIIKSIMASICQDTCLIGFSCYLWNIEKVLFIANVVKQTFPNIKILLGGPEVSYDEKYFLENYPFIDYITTSDGEISHHELLEYLDGKRSLDSVSNLRYLNNSIYVENKIVQPDLSKIKLATLDIEDIENRVVYLESSRGCPYKCSYCTASIDNKIRFFNLDDVLNILKVLMEKRVKTVKFLDRTFNANMNYMINILDFIDKHNISTTFQFEVVVEKLNDLVIEKIKSLKKKYLRFEIGIQSTNNYVNEAVNRYQDMDKLKHNMMLLQNTSKVDLHTDLIAGLPYETKKSFIESFNEVFLLKSKELQLGFLKFLRGTTLNDVVDEHKYIYSFKPPYEIVSNKYMSKEDLDEIRLVEDALDTYYNSTKFSKTFTYLINNNILTSPYHFLLGLKRGMDKSSLYNLFVHFDAYIKEVLPYIYIKIHFLLIEDYLDSHKTKPKIWWDYNISKAQKNILYNKIISIIPLNIEVLYRYATIYHSQELKQIYICIYKDYLPKTYLIRYSS